MACITLGSASAHAADQDVSAKEERIRELWKDGMTAIDAERWEEAWVALHAAHALSPDEPEIRHNLAIAAVHQGHYLQGARLLAALLPGCRHDCPESVLQHAEQMYVKAQQHTGQLKIRTDIKNAVILVDGERLTTAQAISWHVEPGSHDIVVRGAEESKERTVTVASGERATVELLEKPAPRTPPPATTPPPQSTSELKQIVLYSGIAATVVTTGIAITFLGVAGSHQQTVNKLSNTVVSAGDHCRTLTSPTCLELDNTANKRDHATTVAQVSAISAGILGTTTLMTMLLWPKENDNDLALGVGLGSLTLRGMF